MAKLVTLLQMKELAKKEKDTSTIYWQRIPTALDSDILGNGVNDGVHRVRIKVPSNYIINGALTIGLSTDDGAEAGIDDFEILVFPEPEKCAEAKEKEQNNKQGKCSKPSDGGNGEDAGKGKPKKCFKNIRDKVCTPTAAPSPAPTPGNRSAAPVTGPPKTKNPTPAPNADPGTPTLAPQAAPSPTPPSPTPSGATGDPHIFKWNGESYDFHGECDLVLLENPSFNNGQGLHIHIRTKIQRWWSYIESAAVRIGDDTFEAKSGTSLEERKYWVNGVEGHHFQTSRNLNFTVGGFGGRFRAKNDHVIQYKFYLPDDQVLMIRSVKDMLRVEVEEPLAKDFHGGAGLMGSFDGSGALIGRDGETVFEDPNAYGQEWQVGPNDPKVFHTVGNVHYPEQCKMPDKSKTQRRLAGSISRQGAEKACAHVARSEFKDCIFDVMATDDVDAAESY